MCIPHAGTPVNSALARIIETRGHRGQELGKIARLCETQQYYLRQMPVQIYKLCSLNPSAK